MICRAMIPVFLLGLCATAAAEPLVTQTMLKPDPDGMPNEEFCKGQVDMGGGIMLPFELHVTARRNGLLKLANLTLHILDAYDDSLIYDGSLLNAEVVSLDDSGTKFLVISGTAIHTGEKGNEKVPESICRIFRFDPARKVFTSVYRRGNIDLER